MKITVKPARKDGKHPVSFRFEGQPTGFGGWSPSKVINKLLTADKVATLCDDYPEAVLININIKLRNY